MTTTTDAMAADAKTVIDLDGEAITYTQSPGLSDPSINAIPRSDGVDPNRPAGARVAARSIKLAIAKSDVAEIFENQDTVSVPKIWFNVSGGGNVTCRVARVLPESETDPGMWLVRIMKNS